MLCDSGYTIVGLRDFFQKGVCSLNGALAAWGCPHKKKACQVHLPPAGRTVGPPTSPVTPQREAPCSHCGAQDQGQPSGSHWGWFCPPGHSQQCHTWEVVSLAPSGWRPGAVQQLTVQDRPACGVPQAQCQQCHSQKTPVEPKSCSFSRNLIATE